MSVINGETVSRHERRKNTDSGCTRSNGVSKISIRLWQYPPLMRRVSRRVLIKGTLVLCLFSVLAVVYTAVSDDIQLLTDSPPEMTIDNQSNTTVRVTVFESSAESRSDLLFRYTTTEGKQRHAYDTQLPMGDPYRNTTLVDADDSVELVVPPGEQMTRTFDEWGTGANAYVVKTSDGGLRYANPHLCDSGNPDLYFKARSDESDMSSASCT